MIYNQFIFRTKFFNQYVLFLLLFGGLINKTTAQENSYGLIPIPASLKTQTGSLVITAGTPIKVDDAGDKNTRFLKDYLAARLKTYTSKSGNGNKLKPATIVLTSMGSEDLPKEGYRLNITPQKVTIQGKGAGLFYGVQTLIQLFPLQAENEIKLPCLVIQDQPRFGYRGLLLDVSRHFFNVKEVKGIIDLMASYKLNNFQWHLTDDHGWRIEIKKYPKLTQVGAYRTSTSVMPGVRDWFDQVPYGGYYTQEDIKEVVKYAAERHINIIPEIEMPSHCAAALQSYPELKCEPVSNSKAPYLYNHIFCPTENTFKFLEDVITEVAELFPGKYIHIGGDEANKIPWQESIYCQQLIKDLNLKDEHGLQSYFIQRMEKFINSKGKSIIGWDEILEGGLAPNATVMSWRGEDGGIASAQQKHNVIMSPGSEGMYFDNYQSKSDMEPINLGGYAPLIRTYSYDPLPKVLTKKEQSYILGVQANVWTEVIGTKSMLEYMLLPRMLALSEVAWSPLEKKNFKDFSEIRLARHLAKFDGKGYNYRVPEVIGMSDTTLIGSEFTIHLSPPVPGAKIFFTLNGRIPKDTDMEYKEPLEFYVPENEKRELIAMVITPSGRRSVATKTVMYNSKPKEAIKNFRPKDGIRYRLFDGSVERDSGKVSLLAPEQFQKDNIQRQLTYEGYLKIAEDGNYNFSLVSSGGAKLYIANELVVDNSKPHLKFDRAGVLPLSKGYHKIRMEYVVEPHDNLLQVFMGKDGIGYVMLGTGTLYH